MRATKRSVSNIVIDEAGGSGQSSSEILPSADRKRRTTDAHNDPHTPTEFQT